MVTKYQKMILESKNPAPKKMKQKPVKSKFSKWKDGSRELDLHLYHISMDGNTEIVTATPLTLCKSQSSK